MPKISILMTSYNHELYIKESLMSILNQTFKDFELIVVDDCSTDSSFEIIKSFNDPRMKIIRNERNMGPEFAFEILHKAAKGQFIAIADSDNVWGKDKLKKQLLFLEANPQYAAVFTKANIIDEKGNPFLNKDDPYYNVFEVENRTRQDWLNHFFFCGNCLCHPSILIRREAYKDCQMIVNGLWQIPDFYKWIKLCLKHDIYILDEKLINFRVHQNNISRGENIGCILRGTNELYHSYNLFYEIPKEDFLLVFKEDSQFVINGQIHTKFALSKMLLSLSAPAAQLLALNKLFEILNDKKEFAKVYELYGYDAVKYKEDETKYSPLVKNNTFYSEHIITAKLYFDFGNGFNEIDVMKNKFITNTRGKFYLNFKDIKNFCDGRKILKLRFDPCTAYSKIKIDYINSNDTDVDFEINCNNFSSDMYAHTEDYDVFYTDDPSYLITNFSDFIDTLDISVELSVLTYSELVRLKNLEINKSQEKIVNLHNELKNIYKSFGRKIITLPCVIKKFLKYH